MTMRSSTTVDLSIGKDAKSALLFYALVDANHNGILPHLEKLTDHANRLYQKDGISFTSDDIVQSLTYLISKNLIEQEINPKSDFPRTSPVYKAKI